MERKQGLTIIIGAVAECLELDVAAITAGSRLFAELGADSLDLVDLLFTLEKRFGVKLRQGESDLLARLDLANPAVWQDGCLSEQARRDLEPWLPELATLDEASRITPNELLAMITVETLWRLVQQRLGEQP